ncbi:MAG: hypothetical protein JXB15_15075, partial [Anaerolineales bacterium]|nr:hypothetical protein [Anaerolineales bacterium]
RLVVWVGVLLALQSIFLAALFPVMFGLEVQRLPDISYETLFPERGRLAPFSLEFSIIGGFHIDIHLGDVTMGVPISIIAALVFSGLAIPLLITSIVFLANWKHAWMIAVFFQALLLTLALVMYFYFRHPYVYLVMMFSIVLVFYLNYYEVRVAYQVVRVSEGGSSHAA